MNQKTKTELVDGLKAVVSNSVRGNLKLLNRVSDVVRNVGPSLKARDATDAGSVALAWANASLEVYRLAAEHSLSFLGDLVSVAERAVGSPQAASGASAAAPALVQLRIQARGGEQAQAPFLVENPSDRDVEVRFEASPLKPTAGEGPAGSLGTDPESFALPGQGNKVIQAVVTLPPDAPAGTEYSGTIGVVGLQTMRRVVVVAVAAEPRQAEAPKPRAGKTKR